MDKKEYIEKREALFKELRDLKQEYIRTNATIPSGTKVKVHINDKMEYGIMIGYTCQLDDVEPIIAAICKNGSPHASKRIYAPSMAKIEQAE